MNAIKNQLKFSTLLLITLISLNAVAGDKRDRQKGAQDVNIVNTPTVNAEQSGAWSVGVTGPVDVNVNGAPAVTVNEPIQVGLPGKPYHVTIPHYRGDVTLQAGGPGSTGETLAVSSLVFTNLNTDSQYVWITGANSSSGDCSGDFVRADGGPTTYVVLEPYKTMQLTFPVPLVYTPVNGETCIGLAVISTHDENVFMLVNGALY